MPQKHKMTPAEKKRLVAWGKEEAKEHGVSVRFGIKLASDHLAAYGPKYYPRVERLEKRLTKKK